MKAFSILPMAILFAATFASAQQGAPDVSSLDRWRATMVENLDADINRLGQVRPVSHSLTATVELENHPAEPSLEAFLPLLNAPRHSPALLPAVAWILRREGLPLELLRVAQVESEYNPQALSNKGARGLWQLMPDTARRFGLVVDETRDERLDPFKSTVAASRYLQELYGSFHDWPLALAAYNAGEKRVQDSLAREGGNLWMLSQRQALPEETREYVTNVLKAGK